MSGGTDRESPQASRARRGDVREVVAAVLVILVVLAAWLFFVSGGDESTNTISARPGARTTGNTQGAAGAASGAIGVVTVDTGLQLPGPGLWTYRGLGAGETHLEVSLPGGWPHVSALVTSSPACSGGPLLAFVFESSGRSGGLRKVATVLAERD